MKAEEAKSYQNQYVHNIYGHHGDGLTFRCTSIDTALCTIGTPWSTTQLSHMDRLIQLPRFQLG